MEKKKCVKELLEEIALLDELLEKKTSRLEIKDEKIEDLKEIIEKQEAELEEKSGACKKILKEIEAKAKLIDELENTIEKCGDDVEALRDTITLLNKKLLGAQRLADDVVEFIKYGKVK